MFEVLNVTLDPGPGQMAAGTGLVIAKRPIKGAEHCPMRWFTPQPPTLRKRRINKLRKQTQVFVNVVRIIFKLLDIDSR
jgi:hypothetical protein